MDGDTWTSRQILERLIGFDTTSHLSNLALIDWVRDYLGERGIETLLVPDATGTKANLWASIGPDDQPGIVLSGHTDVVPVTGQDWHSDPFTLTDPGDGRLYGRGTCDMKGFLAVALAWVPKFQAAALRRPVHLSLSYDEEPGCLGVPDLLAELGRRAIRPAACIVGEPTGMQVIDGHKGKNAAFVTVRGKECHSSINHTGVSAVEAAGEAIAFLKARQRQFRAQGPFDPRFDPPWTTIQVGTVAGGTAMNIVAGSAEFAFEVRPLPGIDGAALIRELCTQIQAALEPEMHAVDPASGFSFRFDPGFPGLDMTAHSDLARLAMALSGANGTAKVAYGTEAGLFQAAGIPTIICGPGHIEQAHKPDEFVACDQLAACERFMDRLIEHLCR